mmetsp:Transcript_23270/g.67903  ORF Transcript_23270/g.67903 Transcript_23270/m.67903 type:complete len:225 (-) Transcript_23270:1061-1735(-)
MRLAEELLLFHRVLCAELHSRKAAADLVADLFRVEVGVLVRELAFTHFQKHFEMFDSLVMLLRQDFVRRLNQGGPRIRKRLEKWDAFQRIFQHSVHLLEDEPGTSHDGLLHEVHLPPNEGLEGPVWNVHSAADTQSVLDHVPKPPKVPGVHGIQVLDRQRHDVLSKDRVEDVSDASTAVELFVGRLAGIENLRVAIDQSTKDGHEHLHHTILIKDALVLWGDLG